MEIKTQSNESKITVRKLVYASMLLAIALVLPFVTGEIPNIGKMLLPMHLPALICGYVCGGPVAALMGVIAPLLRSVIFGMPTMYPSAIGMAFELAAYGFFAGLLYTLLPKKLPYHYVSLIGAMLIGRVIWGVVRLILFSIEGNAFTFTMFITGAVLDAVPGIILQIIVIPPIVALLQRRGTLYA